jgi:hypothetical protein
VDDKNADDVFTMCKFNIIILYVDGLFLGEWPNLGIIRKLIVSHNDYTCILRERERTREIHKYTYIYIFVYQSTKFLPFKVWGWWWDDEDEDLDEDDKRLKLRPVNMIGTKDG